MNTSIPQKKQKPYVYALYYPESMGGCIFYVGKGREDRIHQHEREAKGTIPIGNEWKCMIIWKIWENGEKVVKKKLAYFDTDQEAFLYEFALLFFLSNLTNIRGGMPRQEKQQEEERRRLAREVTQQANKPRIKKPRIKKPRIRKEKIQPPRLSDEERRSLAREVTRRIAEQKEQL